MVEDDDRLRVRGTDEGEEPAEAWGARLLRWGRDLVLTVVGVSVLWIGLGALRAPSIPEAAPALTGSTLSGAPVSLAEERGHTVVLNFWATWCGPCAMEMPWLVRFAASHPEVPLWFVAVDGKVEQLRAYATAHGLPPERVVIPSADFRGAWQVSTLPTTVVIDRDGRLVAAHAGIVLPPQLWWWTR